MSSEHKTQRSYFSPQFVCCVVLNDKLAVAAWQQTAGDYSRFGYQRSSGVCNKAEELLGLEKTITKWCTTVA